MVVKWPKTEQELAAAVVAWLHDQRWIVYQEVQLNYAGRIADIVAERHGILWVIETKRTFAMRVIEQASWWTHEAHYASVAVPEARWNDKSRGFACRVCRRFGVGVLVAKTKDRICEEEAPHLVRRPAAGKRLRAVLTEGHKTFAAAGNPNGKRWSPWRATVEMVTEYVTKHPGTTLKALIGGIDTHYQSTATARSCIAKDISNGLICGVRTERDGRVLRLYPVGGACDRKN